MCTTNRALVNSLECYMDDLVDCFEDFVKKSIIIISVAVGVLVAVIAYVLKIIAERPTITGPPTGGATTPVYPSEQSLPSVSNPNLNVKKGKFRKRDKGKNFMMFDYQDKDTTTANAKHVSAMSCCDEKVLKNIGFSMCSKTDCDDRLCNQKVSKSRPSIPSLPTGSPPKGSAVLLSKEIPKGAKETESCCSMCCNDKCDG